MSEQSTRKISRYIRIKFVGNINDIWFTTHAHIERGDRLFHDDRDLQADVEQAWVHSSPKSNGAILILTDGTVLICRTVKSGEDLVVNKVITVLRDKSWLRGTDHLLDHDSTQTLYTHKSNPVKGRAKRERNRELARRTAQIKQKKENPWHAMERLRNQNK